MLILPILSGGMDSYFANGLTGIFQKTSSGATTFQLSYIFHNQGLVDVQSGTLDINANGGGATGIFNVASNAMCSFNGGYTFNNGTILSGAGTNRFWSNNKTLNGTIYCQNVECNATLRGTFTISGTTNFPGFFNWLSGPMEAPGQGTIATNTTLLISSFGGGMVERTLTNNGTVIHTDGTIYGGSGIISGTFIYNNGLWLEQGDTSFQSSGGAYFNNLGTFRKTAGTNTVFQNGFGLVNGGTIELLTGLLQTDTSVQTNGAMVLMGGNFKANPIFYFRGGTLSGTNTVFSSIFVNEGGQLNPGLSGAGRLNVTGNYEQTSAAINAGTVDGVMNIEIGGPSPGTDFDKVAITGTATLAGVLNVTLINGFVPPPGSTYQFLTASSQIRTFDTFNYPSNQVAMVITTNATSSTIQVINTPPSLAAIANQTVAEMTLFNLTPSASDNDLPAQSLTFSLTNSPAGATINTNTGQISWTPSETDGPGTNSFTVVVTDNGTNNLSASRTFNVVVNEVNVALALFVPATQTIDESTLLFVNATATDADVPTNSLTFTLVSGPAGLNIAPTGVILWTPTEAQGPSTNVVTIRVSDNGSPSLRTTNSFTVIVSEVNEAPALAPIANQTINPGIVLTITNSAIDTDLPSNSLNFSLISPPSGVAIDPTSGVLTWRPGIAQANTTNAITVRVTDNGSPVLFDEENFTVVVNALAPVILTPILMSSGQFQMQVSGAVGPDYAIQASSTLTNWTTLTTTNASSTPFDFIDSSAGATNHRFYRILLGP